MSLRIPCLPPVVRRLPILCALCAETAFAMVRTAGKGPDWIPLEYRRDILLGSALDFSGMGLHDAPAGKYGWLVSRNGHAEFEGRPGVPARFYGVNLCNSANFLADNEIERMTDRIVRLGYNAIRFHHHDSAWAEDRAARDCLDRLVAACVRKGIYLTTDLYVSRKCAWRELGVDRDGIADPNDAKASIIMTDAGFENWKRFAQDFLTHKNPYTGRSLAEEPAMPLLVLINEPSLHADYDWGCVRDNPASRALWAQWLAEARAENPAAYPTASQNVFPEKGAWWNPCPESSAKAGFWTWCYDRFARRATKFLREELGVRAMIATDNHGPILPPVLKMRTDCGDYTDQHFYAADSYGASKAAREETGLPLIGAFQNFNPLDRSVHRFPDFTFPRVWGKPHVASEWQICGPNTSRAMSGLAIGAFAAVQDWTGVWTFALAHQREKLFDGVDAAPGRYDISLDPLMQAADRLAPLLFLRGDQRTPAAAFANCLSTAAMRADAEGKVSLSPRPNWADGGLEWRARLGVAFEGEPLPDGVEGFDALGNGPQADKSKPDAPPCGVAVDDEKGEIVVSGPRTCGGFIQNGSSFETGALAAKVTGHPALVAATALDGASLADASRILVWHLTDLHGAGFSWGGDIVKSSYWRQTGILNWGSSHLLLHSGEAEVEIKIGNVHKSSLDTNDTNINDNPVVFALGTDGQRECEIPATFDTGTGTLRFTASSRQPFGGCMYYEIVRE